MDDLAADADRGEPLTTSLASQRFATSAPYLKVFDAGFSGHRLAGLLEQIAADGEFVLEFRRSLIATLSYPVMIVALLYGILAWFSSELWPEWQRLYEVMRLTPGLSYRAAELVAETKGWWMPLVPLLAVGLVVGWALMTRQQAGEHFGSWRPLWMFGWIPGVTRFNHDLDRSLLHRLLSQLLEQGLPLDSCWQLATDSLAGTRLGKQLAHVAELAKLGPVDWNSPTLAHGLSRYETALLNSGTRAGDLAGCHQELADHFHRRAMDRGRWVSVLLPISLGVILLVGLVSAAIWLTYGPIIEALAQIATDQGT